MPSTQDIISYYNNNNTDHFLRYDQTGKTVNIHQPLWVDNDAIIQNAINYSNELVAEQINHLRQPKGQLMKVLDLGCGVGNSVFYLRQRFRKDIHFTGISISSIQITKALNRANRSRVTNCDFIEGDFQNLPASIDKVKIAYAIEAFIHSPDAKIFFQQVAAKLEEGGRFVLIDDFLTERFLGRKLSQQQIKYVSDFRNSWLVESLLGVAQVQQIAQSVGLVLIRNTDLTNYLRMGKFRDKLAGMSAKLFGNQMQKSDYWNTLIGNYSKSQCIKKGLINYRFLVFEKVSYS